MAKKPDLSAVKNFFFHYGERVALFACIGIAVLLLVWGLAGATGPGTKNGDPWSKVLSAEAQKVNQRVQTPDGEAIPPPEPIPPLLAWLSRANPGPYTNIPERGDFRRSNPTVMRLLDSPDVFQMDYIYRGYVGYEIRNKVKVLVVGAADSKGDNKGGVAPVMAGQGNAGAGGNLARVLKPRHMLVVSGVFPMVEQIVEYTRALRVRNVVELIEKKELPIVLGLDVFREERGPDGQLTHKDPQRLIAYDSAKDPNRASIDGVLESELSESIYDLANPKVLEKVVHEGLVTPLPKLPEGVKYPDLVIKGDNWPTKDELIADAGDPGMPPMGAANPGKVPANPKPILGKKDKDQPMVNQPAEIEPKEESLKKAVDPKTHKELYERLANHSFNIFHPYGQFPDAERANAASVERFGYAKLMQNGVPAGANFAMPMLPQKGPLVKPMPMPMPMPPMPGEKGAGQTVTQLYDALVRFVDVDVKPGHTYRYHIRVVLQNPNYGKKTEVVQQQWAEIKELGRDPESKFVLTPSFKVPATYHLFAVDQYVIDQLGEKDEAEKAKLKKFFQAETKDYVVVQLHRWFDKDAERDPAPHVVSDWVLLQRLAIRKGELIGPSETIVEMPTWSKGKGDYEMRSTVPPGPKGSKGLPPRKGTTFDFTPTAPNGKPYSYAPLLVDYEGGQKTQKFGNATLKEEAASDLLILMPDGRLVVRNSRADIDAFINDGTEKGIPRQERVEQWRKRNLDVLSAPASGPGPGPGRPAPILGK
jgi:hypothetical protein